VFAATFQPEAAESSCRVGGAHKQGRACDDEEDEVSEMVAGDGPKEEMITSKSPRSQAKSHASKDTKSRLSRSILTKSRASLESQDAYMRP